MNDARLTKLSKFMSLVLRHKPEAVGLVLNKRGWAVIEELVRCHNASPACQNQITRQDILEVIVSCDKQRYALSDDGLSVRANQGHSLKDVVVDIPEHVPPARLYHGTAERLYEAIKVNGLKPMSRQHVHLSSDFETAETVGARHGKPLVLAIDAGRMAQDGHIFWLSANGVWLTKEVDPKYILKPIKEDA